VARLFQIEKMGRWSEAPEYRELNFECVKAPSARGTLGAFAHVLSARDECSKGFRGSMRIGFTRDQILTYSYSPMFPLRCTLVRAH